MQDRRGTPGKVTAAQWEQARAWRAQGASDAEIGRRLGVANTTVGRGLGPRRQAPGPGGEAGRPPAEPMFTEPEPEPEPGAVPGPGTEREPEPRADAEPEPGAGLPPGGGPPAWPLPARGALWSRYAGAMLLHAFLAQAGAGTVLAAAGGEPRDVALLMAVSMSFALGAATTEQFKHLAAAEAGPLAGLGALPGLRALRPALARIADRTDPVALQRMFASAMLAADPVASGVYYVDDHFVPYTGAWAQRVVATAPVDDPFRANDIRAVAIEGAACAAGGRLCLARGCCRPGAVEVSGVKAGPQGRRRRRCVSSLEAGGAAPYAARHPPGRSGGVSRHRYG